MAITDFETAISIHQETTLTVERKKKEIVGQTIEKVFYVLANYSDNSYTYEGFHLCDEAVLIQLSKNQWISWVWLEDDPTSGYSYHLYYDDARIAIEERENNGITFLKQIDQYTSSSRSIWSDETNSSAWKKFIGQKIEDIQFVTKKIDDISFVSDVILNFKNESVRIIAIEEPDPELLPEIENLNFDPIWTMIVFNDEILKKHNRF
ncbi:hypothetical protein C8N46_101607 [Kordia periserrulae]|uniref:Uncharacterized protein n=1 Tax=Kordia periserrulae TaxID=701523 RepID=A0A2T6C6S5_9FLAO|nr:hypothetical protein [Kordia periserrulae]PTX63997.1 hypothetical protein C8N46_101607 [Kordia periserrulae]